MTITKSLTQPILSSITTSLIGGTSPLTIAITTNLLIHSFAFGAGLTKSQVVNVDGGDLVQDLIKQSGTAFNANQTTTARKPKYFDGTSEGINGNPAIKWTSSQVLNYGNITSFDPSTSNWTLFIVLKGTANSAVKTVLTHIGMDEEYIRTDTSDVDWESNIGAPPTSNIASFTSNTATVLTLKFNSSAPAGTNFQSFQDGVMVLETDKTPLPRTTNLVLGARNAPGSDPFLGFIGEHAFYNRALSSGELTSNHNYFSTKWGTP